MSTSDKAKNANKTWKQRHQRRKAAKMGDLYALARVDFYTFLQIAFEIVSPGEKFIPAKYIEAMAECAAKVARGETRRLIVNIPPRYLKSFSWSVAFPAWLLGLDPTLKIVCVSYSNELSRKFANDFRALVRSKRYREIFPGTRVGRLKDTELEVETTRRGYRLATSVEGTLTGRGGDIMIIDDPMKAEDAASEVTLERTKNWFTSTAFSRLNDKETGRIVLVMQRLHVDDLSGVLIDKGGWEVEAYPAITSDWEVIATGGAEPWSREPGDVLHPDRESLETLEKIRETIGSAQFSAQYLQEPVPLAGNMIKREWFRTYDVPPERRHRDVVIQSLDTASKNGAQNDYSVCITALRRNRDYYILDVFREKLDFPGLKRAVKRLADRFIPNYVFVEDAGSGTLLVQEFREGTGLKCISNKPQGDKVSRVYLNQGTLESGHVFVPKSAPWLDAFMHELAAFPRGRHDDQVDALSQLLLCGERRRRAFDDVQIGFAYGDPIEREYKPEFYSLPGDRSDKVTVISLPPDFEEW